MADDPTQNPSEALTPAQQALAELWERHLASEFETKSATEAVSTMVPDAYVNHMPVLTGGRGHDALGHFYAHHFIPKMPPDLELVPISRTIGTDQLVDEMVIRFTHTVTMDWMLPGIPPPGSRSRFRWSPSFGSGATSSRTSTSTGTRRRCSPSSA